MSYILDALRKADAQREGNPARGIHAQPLQGVSADTPGWRAKRSFLWAGGVVAVGAIALTAWVLHRPAPASTILATAPHAAQEVPVAAVRPPMPAQVPAAQVMPPPVFVAPAPLIASPSVIPVQAPAPLIAAPAATGQPTGMTPFHGPQGSAMVPPSVNPAVPAPANPAMTAAPNSPAAYTPPPPPPPQVAAPRGPLPPSQPLPPVHGLPPDAPKLVINGGVYSANKAQRMLIVNGQVAAEGADLGSGVKLEQITAKSAVLSFRGARYTVGY